MRVASRALAISSSVLVRAASNTSLSADGAPGRAAATRSAMNEGRKRMPARPAFLRAPLLSVAVERIDDVIGADHAAPAGSVRRRAPRPRPASTISVDEPSLRRIAAAGPSDLKPVMTVTGFGFSMKCAPSCSATMASSFASRMRARMSARRSLKFMAHVSRTRCSVKRCTADPGPRLRLQLKKPGSRVCTRSTSCCSAPGTHGYQTSSVPAASPRSVSSNSSSSGRVFAIMPCWCT